MKPSATRCYTSDIFFCILYQCLDKQSRKNACKVVLNILIKIFNNKNFPFEVQWSAVKTYIHWGSFMPCLPCSCILSWASFGHSQKLWSNKNCYISELFVLERGTQRYPSVLVLVLWLSPAQTSGEIKKTCHFLQERFNLYSCLNHCF